MKIRDIIERCKSAAGKHGFKRILNRLEEIDFSPEYAEPGYRLDRNHQCILFGNWNNWGNYKNGAWTLDDESKMMDRIVSILDKCSDICWSDEWSTCSECSKAFRTQADSYGWQRSYWEGDGEHLCLECAAKNAEDVLLSFENEENKAITRDLGIDPAQHGYWLAQEDFENGWHGGQDADPAKIAKTLREKGIYRFLFRIDSVGQFDLKFSLFIHEDEKLDWEKHFEGVLSHEEYKAKEDPSVVLDRGLRACATTPQPPGEGIIVSKIMSDGTVETKRVSPEDFIAGKALD